VDLVHSEQVCTTECTILSIDLKNVTYTDLSFSSPFTIVATRDDYIHALVPLSLSRSVCCTSS